jgi:radical SAM superfamily enzyme YgiQ (UPF0313 family)
MRVVLAKPYNLSDHIQPSLGLGYLATAARARHDVTILDCIKERLDVDRLERYLRRHRPDVLGFQCYTFDLPFIRRALEMAKRAQPGIVTLVGGPHPSAIPEEMMAAEPRVDYLFAGEAEIGLPRLLDVLDGGSGRLDTVPGLHWRDQGRIRANPGALTEDLDDLGMPAWDLIRPDTYPECQHGAFYEQFPIAPIMVTRGCPCRCAFCTGSVVSGRRIRRRSAGHVLGELRHLYERFGIREFHVVDDNFTADPEQAKTFLRQLKAADLKMTWAVPNGVRLDTLDEELLALMKDTGLYLVSVGVESGSDRILAAMRKGTTTARIRQQMDRVRRAGIDIAGFFVLGFPGETRRTILDTIRFAVELPLIRANFFTYLPFPGSDTYRMLQEAGELEGVDWNRFYFMTAAYVPRGLTRKALKRLHRLAFARFFLRPRILWRQIRAVKSARHALFLARRVFRWIGMS